MKVGLNLFDAASVLVELRQLFWLMVAEKWSNVFSVQSSDRV
jgi:hypothetical protein